MATEPQDEPFQMDEYGELLPERLNTTMGDDELFASAGVNETAKSSAAADAP